MIRKIIFPSNHPTCIILLLEKHDLQVLYNTILIFNCIKTKTYINMSVKELKCNSKVDKKIIKTIFFYEYEH